MTPFTPGALTEDVAIQTSSELQQLLNSTYANLNSRSEAEFVSVFTDEVGIGFANGGQGLDDDFVFYMTPSAGAPGALWNGAYFTLARANRVITIADKITPVDAADASKIANIKAQALVVRAFCHLRILSYFTPDMKDNNALAGVLADHVFKPEEKTNPRATNGAFYSLIHSDLDNAIALYNANPMAQSQVAANLFFAMGLKARAYAYKGDYANAETWADNVITSGVLTLATPTQYKQMFFSDTNSSEVMFKLKRTPNQNSQGFNLHNAWCSIRPNLTGSPFYEVGRSLHNVLNPTNLPANTLGTLSDVRANVIIAPSSVVDVNYATSSDYRNTDKLIINKHGGVATGSATWATAATNANNNDIKVMRLSEMYLIKAEARAAAGDLAGAATAVQAIRTARNTVAPAMPVYGNATAAWAGILNERRIEFAFEGYRFLDLKRLGNLAGLGIDRDAADYTSSSANYPGANPSNLPMSSHKWALPIPQDEVNVNSAIQQNIGY
ncbi:RagB/SusD family nutrient uptake outer membrane protein [Amniculibacterium aquaticum]|uniref:RagB/SusD family nutrient uptake outer membrane protein n=1 Tax=Amniculibacterium aquaticum TaxID=2479858 RepID=UPI0013DD8C63|nr:RagB/SusD family nutrient uptake outer membrane protein [Amniculibacterium aquaticum]